MNKGKILLIGLAGMLAVACATDTVDQPQATPEASNANKFVNTSSDAVQGKLLFYVDEGSVAQLEAATSASNTGLGQIDADGVGLHRGPDAETGKHTEEGKGPSQPEPVFTQAVLDGIHGPAHPVAGRSFFAIVYRK